MTRAKLQDLEIDFVLDVSALGVRNMAKMNKSSLL